MGCAAILRRICQLVLTRIARQVSRVFDLKLNSWREKGGDILTKENLGELILNSENQLYATAKIILGNDEDCADAISETIVKAFEKRETLKKENYAKTWLIRILINECYSLLRRQKKYVSMETTEIPERKQPEKTDYSELYQAVSELKDELKLPVILYYAEDFSIKEIAEILEITEGAVQKRLARARGKLKKAFEHKEVFV